MFLLKEPTGVSGIEVESWPLPETSAHNMEEMRRIRDELKNRVKELVER